MKLTPGRVLLLPIDDLVPDPAQPRQHFDAQALQDLADNIKARGIQQPIMVQQDERGVLITTGERRWRAARLAGLDKVPCLLDARHPKKPRAQDIDRLFDQLAENDLREDLNPMERARALDRLRQDGMGPTEIADELALHGMKMSRPAVSNTLRLLKFPDGVQTLVADGRMRESYARDLLQFTGYPKILDAFVEEINRHGDGEIARDLFADAVNCAVYDHAEILGSHEHNGCKNCKCLAKVPEDIFAEHYDWYCLEPDKIKAKRDARNKGKQPDEESPPAKKKKTETDPTKVKPVKVTPNADGVVATSRRAWKSYKSLYPASFDTTRCEECPHNHLASNSGDKGLAQPTCFYVPCFDNLLRQHSRIVNRQETIRSMLDQQGFERLIEVATQQPVANELVMPLLAFHTATHEGSFYQGLEAIVEATRRHDLADYLNRALSDEEASTVVGITVSSLPKERRHELALHLSLDVASFWHTDEDFAKLFRKAELKEMLPDFDPPDVPVGEWQQRLVNEVGVPESARQVWLQDWVRHSILTDPAFDDGPRCRKCGCTDLYGCDEGCSWVEPPDENQRALCSACADDERAVA